MNNTTPPTESALRAARASHPALRDDEYIDLARIIDTSCHLPEIKLALEKAREALEFYAHSPNYAIPATTGQSVGEYGSIVQRSHGRTAKAALAKINEVKI